MAIYESVLASPSPPAYPNVKYQIKNTQKNILQSVYSSSVVMFYVLVDVYGHILKWK